MRSLIFVACLTLVHCRPQQNSTSTSAAETTTTTTAATISLTAASRIGADLTVNCVDPKKYDCDCLDQHQRGFCQSKHPAEVRPDDQLKCITATPDQLVLDQCPIGPPCFNEINNCACLRAVTRKDCAELSPPATRPREFENCMNEPPTEKAQKACPGTCEQDTHDCNCVALKQKKSCSDLHEKAKFDCLTKPAAAHVLEQCPKKKISF